MDRFGQALQSYSAAQYADAIEIFEALAEEGYNSYELQYNLGNAWFKHGNIGRSILAFERALRFRPNDADAQHNLNVVRARTRDRVEPVPLLFFVQWWNELRSSYLPDDFFILSVIFLWMVAIAAFIFFGFRSRLIRRVALTTATIAALLCTVSFILYQQRLSEYEEHRFAVVMSAQLTVMSAADETAIESFVVHEGLTVEILDRDDQMLHIRLADGKTGWVPAHTIERI